MRYVRGQNAVEYMMTYGWAILVVLVAGVMVWQMGILELSRNITPDKRGFSQVTPLDWGLRDDGSFVVVVQNNAGTILEITDVGAILEVGGSGACTLDTVVPIDNFRPASTQRVDFSDCTIDGDTGDYYRMNLTIRYQNKASALPHVSNGVLWGPIG